MNSYEQSNVNNFIENKLRQIFLCQEKCLYLTIIIKTDITMTNSQKMQEVTGVDNLLKEAGLQDIVDVSVEVYMNQYGKVTPHVVARYTETVKGVNDTKDGWVYLEKVTEKIEELNKYFCSGIFAMGITQRAEWLKASHKERTAYLSQPGFHHPAHYGNC